MQKTNSTAITISDMQREIDKTVSDPQTLNSLMKITFNGLDVNMAKQAMLEALMRGYNVKDFLEKNIYAIPYGGKYSLVSGIDHFRKIGMRSGICGKDAPIFEINGSKIVSCTITVKRMIKKGIIGEFSSTAFFDEYNTGRNLWIKMPRTMISKVAEMQALRMACPEVLSEAYIEEEFSDIKVVGSAIGVKTNIQSAEIIDLVDSGKISYLTALLKKVDRTPEKFLTYLGKEKMTDLSEVEIDNWIDKFEKQIDAIKSKEIKEVKKEDNQLNNIIKTFGGEVIGAGELIEEIPATPKKGIDQLRETANKIKKNVK